MKRLVILRSVTGQARKYADRHFKHFTWYDSLEGAMEALKEIRPWFVVVDGGHTSLGLGSRAAGMGYVVENKGVP